MILVQSIPRVGLLDLPTHGQQVRALMTRSGVQTWEEFARMLGFDPPPAEGLIVVGDLCAMLCLPGQRPERLFRLQDMPAKHSAPPPTRMAGNLARALAAVAKNALTGAPITVGQEISRARLAVCAECPHLQGNRCMDITLADGTLAKGCGCNLRVKAELADMRCPQGKWKE